MNNQTPIMNKYISGILLIGALALIGAGCTTPAEENTNSETTTSAVEETAVETTAVETETETEESSDQVVQVEEEVKETQAEAENDSTDEVDTSDWLTYTDEEFGLTLNYPASLGEMKIKAFEPSEYQNGHKNWYTFTSNENLSFAFMSSDYAFQGPVTDFNVLFYSSLDFSLDENELADELKAYPVSEITVSKESINGHDTIVQKQSYPDALNETVEWIEFIILNYSDGKDISISSKPSDEDLIRQLIKNLEITI